MLNYRAPACTCTAPVEFSTASLIRPSFIQTTWPLKIIISLYYNTYICIRAGFAILPVSHKLFLSMTIIIVALDFKICVIINNNNYKKL